MKALLIASLLIAHSAFASFHFMQVEQVIGSVNGDTTAQAIQLRMRSGGQNIVSGSRVRVWDAAGANPVLILDMTTNVSTSTSGSRVLLATSAFTTAVQAVTPGFTPDFTIANAIPAGYLAAGRLTFESDSGTILWSIAWGGATYTGLLTGDTTNDSDGNFGPAFAQGLPTTGLQGLLFQGTSSALSTNNAADYALSASPATVRNNSGASSPIGSTSPVNATLSSSSQAADTLTPLTVHVTGLTTGETVIVERFLDMDSDAVIDTGEFLVERFSVTDGQVTIIGGIRNTNIPGDEDSAANGQISMRLTPATGPELGRGAGSQIVRVSSPTTTFPAISRTLITTQPSAAQSISGAVRDTGNIAVPFAIVVLLDALKDGAYVSGVVANGSGQFSINAPVGTYKVFAVKPGFVGNFETGPTVVLTAGATPTQNVSLTAATTSISGKVADDDTNIGLPGVQLFVQSQTGLVALLSTNANGNYSAQVTSGQWQIQVGEFSLSHLGYLTLSGETDPVADTTAGAASNVNILMPKATALIYGTVKDQSNNPVNGVNVDGDDQVSNYDSKGYSMAPNATYTLAVNAGTWSVGIESESLPAGYVSSSGTDVTLTAGQAVETNLTVTAITARLRGQIQDDTGAPIPNITLVLQKYPFNSGGAGSIYPTTDPSGNFDVGVYAGTWNIALECVESQQKSYVNVADLEFSVTDGLDQNGIVLTFPRSSRVITGTVKDAFNNPIQGVLIDAGAQVGSIRYFPGCVATDANGSYTLRVLNASWEINVRGDDLTERGYNPVSSQTVVIAGANGVANFIAQDTSAPTLDSSAPANGASNVVLNSTVKFTFSERMGPGYSINWSPSVDGSKFILTWSTDLKTLTCTYNTNLPSNTLISWTLNKTGEDQYFRDLANNALAPEVSGNFTTGTTLGLPEIVVEQAASNIADSGAKNFGSVTVGSTTELEFKIKNTGIVNLTLSGTPKIVISGTDAARFTVTAQPASPVAVDESTTFTIRFAPTSAGLKTAALSIANNDTDENPFNITLSGTGVAAVLPVVTTLAASGITVDGATLNGTVNAKGTDRTVTFKYGTTTAYGTTLMATPGTVSTNTALPVSVTLTDLMPHTKYNFLVRADGVLGAKDGTNLTFTTLNTAPHADDDSAVALPGGVLTLNVLTNDHDEDGDTLKLSAVTAPPAAAGTAKIVGNNIVFTAAAAFAGTSFNYTVSDGFGKTDTGTVSVTLGTCTLNPAAVTLTSSAQNDVVAVAANTTWSVVEALPWVVATPTSGSGNANVTLAVQANTTKLSRRGVITIGGKEHIILQAGTLGFTIEEPASIPTGMVSANYALTISSQQTGVKFAVSGLSTMGLVINPTTGLISGKPKLAGSFKATITGTVAATGASTTIIIPITIQPLPVGAVGNFHGPIARAPLMTDNANLGGRFELTTTTTGSFSGKLIFARKTYAFPATSTLNATIGNASPTVAFNIPSSTLQVSFTIDSANNRLTNGIITEGSEQTTFDAWRNAWITAGISIPEQNDLNRYLGFHTIALHVPESQPTLPQGSGFGSFTVAAKTGALTASGLLADGTSFTCTTFAGPYGEVLIFQPLYSGKGSILGALNITPGSAGFTPPYGDNSLSGTVSWLRPAAVSTRLYPSQLGPYNLTAVGGRYVPPTPSTSIVMGIIDNLITPINNAELNFSGADFVAVNPSLPFRLKASSAYLKPTLNNAANTSLAITPATGAFKGTFSLSETSPVVNPAVRPSSFSGVIVRDIDNVMRGYGFFILADLPRTTGQTVNNTNQQSGLVILEKL